MKTEELIALRRRFHQIPEIGFKEFKTQQLILEILEPLPRELEDKTVAYRCTCIYTRI